VGVKTAEGEYKADALIINADFADAMRKLVPDKLRRRWTDAKIDTKRISCSTYMMYLGIDGRYDDLPHHTIYTSDDYVGNLQDIEVNGKLSPDPSFYVQNACITDDTMAPKGQSTLYLLAPVPNNRFGINWKQESPRLRELLLKQLRKVGVTDLEKRIRYEKIVTPMDWQSNYAVYQGATFNLAHNLMQMLHLRPRNRFDELDGVYLVGGGTHPGSGLPVIYESARITTRLLLQDFQRDVQWLGEPGAKDDVPLPQSVIAS
jgi:phytoene desaturase